MRLFSDSGVMKKGKIEQTPPNGHGIEVHFYQTNLKRHLISKIQFLESKLALRGRLRYKILKYISKFK
jgi:hypothetical protein